MIIFIRLKFLCNNNKYKLKNYLKYINALSIYLQCIKNILKN